MIDIAVVGGGPGGLAAAVAAKVARPSLRVAVFERAPALEPPRGAVLAVVPNGIKALSAVDPELSRRVRSLDLGVQGVRAELKNGTVLFEDASGRRADRTAHLGPSSLCTWHALRKTLAVRARELGVELVLDSAFESFQEEEEVREGEGFIRLRFSSPSSSSSSSSSPSSSTFTAEARLLVGADGSRSRVRAQVVAERKGKGKESSRNGDGNDGSEPAENDDDGEPTYSGTAAWRGVLRDLPRDWDRKGWGWCAFVGSQEDAGSPRVVTYPVPARKLLLTEGGGDSDGGGDGDGDLCLVWQLFCRFPAERLPELSSRLHYAGGDDATASSTSSSPPKKIQRALEALGEGWPPFLVDAIRRTDPSQVAEHGVYFREADEGAPWGSRGRVTLLGDAAHLGTPLLGQGSAAAFEDALALGHELKRAGETETATLDASLLRRYEQKRIPRATAIQRASVNMYKRQGSGERVDEIGEHLKLGFMEVEFESL